MEAWSDGVRIHFAVAGEGPPVLLVHGYPLSGEMWREVVDRLSGDYRLIVPDLRGHGQSEASDVATMEDHAADLRAVLEAAGESRPVVLAGMSMGGYVSLAFCRRYRDRVRGLALVDSRASADMPEAARVRRETADRVLRDGTAFIAEEMTEKLFARGARRDLREQWRARMEATSRRGVAAALRGMAVRADSEGLLRKLEVPLLVVVGEEDTITPLEGARAMADAAGARLEIISGAGHMSPVEQPESVARALRRFFEEIDGAR